jgi:hypothetical protein
MFPAKDFFDGMTLVGMKTVTLIAALVLCLIIVLPVSAGAAGTNTGPITWSLDSKLDKDGKKLALSVAQMEKNFGTGDDGQSGSVSISGGKSYIWISDQAAEADITMPNGAWVLQIVTDSDWGTKGSKFQLEIGEWDGSFKSLTPPPQKMSARVNSKVIIGTLFQSGSITIRKKKFIAIKVTNLDTKHSHIIYTGEGANNSYLRSPETFAAHPVPELSAGILFALGLAGLSTFIVMRRNVLRRKVWR